MYHGAKLTALVMAGCAGIGLGGGTPGPKPGEVRPPGVPVVYEDGRSADGDTLRYTLRWGAGAGATSYGVRVTAASQGGWTGLPNGSTTTSANWSFTAVNLTAWGTVTFTARVWSLGPTGLASRDTASVSWTTARRPTGPGPITVDTLLQVSTFDLVPDQAALAAGQDQQFCVVYTFRDGRQALPTAHRTRPGCASYLPSVMRVASAAQQQYADSSYRGLTIAWQGTPTATVTVGPGDVVSVR